MVLKFCSIARNFFMAATSSAHYQTGLALILGYVALAASGCAVASWKSALRLEHPLTGQIWSVASGGFIDRRSLIGRLARADFVLLGEKHDNPDHHLLQAEVLRGLIAVGRRPAVGFEMFGLDDATAIADHLALAPDDAAGLGRAVGWEKRGWPEWTMYQPIAEAALEARLSIVATNLPSSAARRMRSGGLAALEPRAIHELGLHRPLSQELHARMSADLRESHCGYVSGEGVEMMIGVQRARDAQMAQSLIAAGGSGGAILVAGAGHVRNDYGIPVYLAAMAAGKRVVSIAFVEVDPRKTGPHDYAPPYSHGRLPFDYVWFTPRVDDEDPCEKFKAQLERLKKAP